MEDKFDLNEYINDKNKAEKMIKDLNLEEAKKFLEDLVSKYSSNAEIYDLYSEVLISLDYTKEAKKAIEKSIKLDPNSSADKYMTLGQLTEDPKKKRDNYLKGIEVYKYKLDLLSSFNKNKNNLNMESLHKDILNTDTELHIRHALSSALSSVAEIYMTTYLCDEPNAENTCEEVLKEAITICDDNPDVLIQYSNLRILRKKDSEAQKFMDKAFNIIINNQNSEFFPDCEIICNLAKNYSELGNYYQAIKLLDIITQLDEHNSEYWYLLAFNHFNIKNYLHSSTCMERLKQVINENKEIDDELSIAVSELENELKKIEKKEGELKNSIFEQEENGSGKEECISNGNSMIIDD